LRATVISAAVGLVVVTLWLAARFDRLRPLDEALETDPAAPRGPALLIDTPPAIAGAD
jgi:hypothetical protein